MEYLLLAYDDEQRLATLSAGEHRSFDVAWRASVEVLRESGYLLALASLPGGSTVTLRLQNGEVSLIEGPHVSLPEQLTTLLFINAGDLNEAIRVASQLPQARRGAIEVRPVVELEWQ